MEVEAGLDSLGAVVRGVGCKGRDEQRAFGPASMPIFAGMLGADGGRGGWAGLAGRGGTRCGECRGCELLAATLALIWAGPYGGWEPGRGACGWNAGIALCAHTHTYMSTRSHPTPGKHAHTLSPTQTLSRTGAAQHAVRALCRGPAPHPDLRLPHPPRYCGVHLQHLRPC